MQGLAVKIKSLDAMIKHSGTTPLLARCSEAANDLINDWKHGDDDSLFFYVAGTMMTVRAPTTRPSHP